MIGNIVVHLRCGLALCWVGFWTAFVKTAL